MSGMRFKSEQDLAERIGRQVVIVDGCVLTKPDNARKPKSRSKPVPTLAAPPQPVVAQIEHAATMELPYPPSVNTYWRHPTTGPCAGRSLISKRGREYRKHVESRVLVLVRKGLRKFEGLIRVEIVAFPPDRRQRDLDNICKALLDSLTHAGVWSDDDQIDDLRITRARNDNGDLLIEGRVDVTITTMRRAACTRAK